MIALWVTAVPVVGNDPTPPNAHGQYPPAFPISNEIIPFEPIVH